MFLETVKLTIEKEIKSLEILFYSINVDIETICQELSDCKGKIIFLGVGKSGHIGKKLAATFSSTGSPSFFIHGTEAIHGDSGMIEEKDIVLLLSNSGNTQEVVNVLPILKEIGCRTIGFTSNEESILAQNCDYKLLYPKSDEADHLGLAPTSSSTSMLVLGDAIACALSKYKDFTRKDFYKYHPGGSLGKLLKGD